MASRPATVFFASGTENWTASLVALTMTRPFGANWPSTPHSSVNVRAPGTISHMQQAIPRYAW